MCRNDAEWCRNDAEWICGPRVSMYVHRVSRYLPVAAAATKQGVAREYDVCDDCVYVPYFETRSILAREEEKRKEKKKKKKKEEEKHTYILIYIYIYCIRTGSGGPLSFLSGSSKYMQTADIEGCTCMYFMQVLHVFSAPLARGLGASGRAGWLVLRTANPLPLSVPSACSCLGTWILEDAGGMYIHRAPKHLTTNIHPSR